MKTTQSSKLRSAMAWDIASTLGTAPSAANLPFPRFLSVTTAVRRGREKRQRMLALPATVIRSCVHRQRHPSMAKLRRIIDQLRGRAAGFSRLGQGLAVLVGLAAEPALAQTAAPTSPTVRASPELQARV